jgi:hypothetical protein
MNIMERGSLLAGSVLFALLASALIVLLPPRPVAAQTAGDGDPPGWRIKHDVPPGQRIKHDVPPGPPCDENEGPPCPPGQDLKHDLNPPGWPFKHDGDIPGQPCDTDDRPCPPGQELKHDGTPGNAHDGGSASEGAFAPSELLVRLVNEAGMGTLPVPTPVPPQAQRQLYEAVAGGAKPWLTGLAEALSPEGNEDAWYEAVELVGAVQDLPYGDVYLSRAAEAFNAFIDASSETFMADPAPELIVVHTFLGALVEEAVRAPERSGAS